MYFILSRRLRTQDLHWLQGQSEPLLVLLGEALLSDFSHLKPQTTLFALQEEIKETGMVPQFEGKVELKNGGDLVELLLGVQVIHL